MDGLSKVRRTFDKSIMVELRGIEPRSSSVDSGLLRVQSVGVVFSAPALDADTSPTGSVS